MVLEHQGEHASQRAAIASIAAKIGCSGGILRNWVRQAELRKLAHRGLRGVKLVISDAHEGLKTAVAEILNATWQRCRVHFQRNALAHAGRPGRRVVSAFIATAFAQE